MSPTVLITGTSRGIGRALAEHYLRKGFNVAGCSRTATDLSAANYLHVCLDVTDEKAVCAFVRAVYKHFGALDILINNAGAASMNHLALTPLGTAERIVGVNFLAPFLFTREAAKIMMKKRSGRIVNLSTVAVPLNLSGEAVYASSKAAVEELTRIAAKELAEMGITVNAVGPTPVETDLIKNVPAAKIRELLDKQALKRFAKFSDIANAVDFFIAPESDFITGQILYLGGVCGR